MSVNNVALHFGCSRQTIHYLRTRYATTGEVRDRLQRGRPQASSGREDHFITVTNLRNRFIPATVTARQLGVSAQTICNRLKHNRALIRARRPYRGQIINAHHRAACLACARRHRHWTRAQWRNMIFTDESGFRVSFADGKVRVHRRQNERFAQCSVQERDSIMVWAGIMDNERTDSVIVQGNLDAVGYVNILRIQLLPFMQNQGQGVILQHDNARPLHSSSNDTVFGPEQHQRVRVAGGFARPKPQ